MPGGPPGCERAPGRERSWPTGRGVLRSGTRSSRSSETSVYLIGVLPCLLATIALGLVLSRSLADRRASTAAQGLVAGLAVITPMTFRAVHWGHPEELLAGALCVGALLAALRERELLAGILLGPVS